MKYSIKFLALVLTATILTGCVGVPKTVIDSYETDGNGYVHKWKVSAAPNVDLSGLLIKRTRSGTNWSSIIGIKEAQSTNSTAVIDSSSKGTVDIINASGELMKQGIETGIKAAGKTVIP